MRQTIWFWFMEFVFVTFLLLWICQVLFLQNFYERMKTKDIIRIADQIVELYEQGVTDNSSYRSISIENELCIEIRDGVNINRNITRAHGSDSSCMIHGPNDNKNIIKYIQDLRSTGEETKYGWQEHPVSHLKVLSYTRVIGSLEHPKAYLVLNARLAPVSGTISIIRRQLVLITLLLAIIAVIISMIVADRLAKPIVRVTKEAEQLAHGNYNIQFDGSGYDEAERLAETLTYASHEINRIDTMQRDLIANASHDLRTPLTMLKAYAEMIRDLSGDNPVKRAEHLQVIIEETDRLTALVNDILDLSKYENGKMTLERESFDMEARLREIVQRYRGLSEVSGYEFLLETDGAAPVFCDAGKIEQVICNLMNNAMNYTGEDKKIYVSLQHEAEGIRISIRDTGKGMNQETISRIFDKYYRSENYQRAVRGTGLGLSIVKAILRLHDYAFGVNSQVGVGSVFWFIIHPEEQEQP